jgi:hypothetical protein
MCSKKVRSKGLVLAFVSGFLWRPFISCQMFRETGKCRTKEWK